MTDSFPAAGSVTPGDSSTPAQTMREFDLRLRNRVPWLAGITASYLFQLSGDDGGVFHIVVNDGLGSAGPGSIDDPDVRFTMTARTFMSMKHGTIDDGAIAFLNGEVAMEGDQALAVTLAPLWFESVDMTSYLET